MLWTMPLVRHLLVSLLTLALTVGTGRQSCATLQQQHSFAAGSIDLAASHQGHDHHQHAVVYGDHGLGGDRNLLLANKGEPTSVSHACLKCCGACMLISILPPSPGWTLALAVTHVSFASCSEQLRGHIVFVDPDIPKQIV